MGSSKSNTGIKLIDDTVDTVINKGTNAAAKNVERNAQNTLQGLGTLASGNWNNADRTLLDLAGFGLTGGLANPDDVGRMTGKQTATERMTTEAQNAAKAAEVASETAKNNLALDGIRSTISGQVGARMRAPGRGLTLLGEMGGRQNTLLSIMGG